MRVESKHAQVQAMSCPMKDLAYMLKGVLPSAMKNCDGPESSSFRSTLNLCWHQPESAMKMPYLRSLRVFRPSRPSRPSPPLRRPPPSGMRRTQPMGATTFASSAIMSSTANP
ncbi:hypothetical protein PIB30_074413 [Stylosanthes scabra]|uniref:Uncharacterized protein n=1 Tax=Stylosanthes scabra TaxID=79078 RepID=A0ABU6UTD2_9FABA|nr:hypothetical protein [Stylosanthes scabra]